MTCLKNCPALFILFLCCNAVELVRVKVEQGWLQGEKLLTSTKLKKYYSFKGIPYAAPPVGDLRFRAPEPPLKWEGIRNSTEHGSICVQRESYQSERVIGDEDCLFLNVYSPKLTPNCLQPVLFFIHGGTFVIGSGNSEKYGPDFLMPFNVVLVTINYRLGPFGFLAVDTEDVPGNAGMKDTIAALKWVQKNIVNFGGDPNRVTIMGDSSGGSIVSLHVVSPAAKNLFQRAIIRSGTIFNDWALTFEPRRRSFALGRALGLNTNDPYKLIDFLRSIPAPELIRAKPDIFISDSIISSIYILTYFTPNIEKKFGNGDGQYLTTQPTALMCKREINQVDVMIGHTANEGLVNTAEFESKLFEYYPKYKRLLVPIKISYFRSLTKVLELAARVNSFYFNNQTISLKNVRAFVNFNSYFRYVFDIHAYIERLPKLPGVRRYFYEFRIYSTRNVYSRYAAERYGIKQASHLDDLAYIFDGDYYNQTIDVNSKVFNYIELTCKLVTNFVKCGNPTPDDALGTIWPEYDPNRGAIDITPNGTLVPGTVPWDSQPDLIFWRNLYYSTGITLA